MQTVNKDPFEDNRSGNILNSLGYKLIPYWPIFIIACIISVLLAWYFIKLQTPIFEANAQLLLKGSETEKLDTKVFEDLVQTDGNKIIENEIELIRSSKVLELVVKEMNLYTPVFFKGKFRV